MAVFLLYRVVKLTSPLINYFLIVGSYMMFFSIYIRVLPYTGESVNTYRCNVSLTSVRNSYVRYCYPTDSTMDEHDCILLWIWHHPHKDGKSLQDISQSKHQKESNCEYHTIQYYRRVFYLHENQVFFICTIQGITPFNTVFYMHVKSRQFKMCYAGYKGLAHGVAGVTNSRGRCCPPHNRNSLSQAKPGSATK